MSRFLQSFAHAWDGVVDAARVQPNLTIHMVIAALVLVAAIALHVAVWGFVDIVVLIALVLGLELMNTAIEAYVDLATLELHPVAKRAKDAAAGAVLVASACSVLAGLAIFIDAAGAETALAVVGIAAAVAVLWKVRTSA
jgi:undecaprenol kinase